MNLRRFFTFIILSVVLGPWSLVCSHAQSGIKNLQLSGTSNQVNSGATLTAVAGSTLAVNGTFSGTPTGGTLNLTNVTVTGLSGSGGTWGSITGTLSAQTDLQSALDAKLAASTLNGYFADPSTNGSFSASAWRSDLGLVIGTNVQAYDADLTTWAGVTPSANGQSLVAAANYAAMRSLLTLVVGTDVQAYDADLTTWAGVTPGTGIATALAVNTGSAGAPVLFNGAGGTPSSLTLTNATGLPSSGIAAATLVIESEGIASNDNDTTLPTSAAVRDYVDGLSGKKDVWMIAISDETTALTTGTAKVTFRAPRAATVTGVRASLTTVSSSGTPTFDINEGGTTILSTKLTVDASEKTSTTAAAAAVISDTVFHESVGPLRRRCGLHAARRPHVLLDDGVPDGR